MRSTDAHVMVPGKQLQAEARRGTVTKVRDSNGHAVGSPNANCLPRTRNQMP